MKGYKALWRIEEKDSKAGLYLTCPDIMEKVRENVPSTMRDNWATRAVHPVPGSEPALGWKDMHGEEKAAWYFGFPSLKAARRWVGDPEIADDLDARNMVLRRYRVAKDSCRHGIRQSIFKPMDADTIKEYPVSWLWDKQYDK